MWCTMVVGGEENVVGVGVTTDVVEGVRYLEVGAWWSPD